MPHRNRTGLRVAALAAVLALPGSALAASEEPVAGQRARIRGVTVQKASFGERLRYADFLDLSFGDGTFAANAVSGAYVQKDEKLGFRIDPARLRAFEASWRAAFLADLREDGLEPGSVACEIDEAKLKGRVRDGEVKLASSYRLHCRATGDFGEIEATARKRFRGRGLLEETTVQLQGHAGGNILLVGVGLPQDPSGPGSAGGLEIQSQAGLRFESVPATAGDWIQLQDVTAPDVELLEPPRD